MVLLKHSVKGRYIRGNQGKRMPRHVMVLDTETKTEEIGEDEHHVMKIAWSIFASLDAKGKPIAETWKYFDRRFELCSYVSAMAIQFGGLTIVGNNIFFDLQVMGFFKYLPEMGWQLDFIYENGITYILIIKREGKKITCISLTNYLEASVKDLGAMLGNPKIEVDFDTATKEQLMIYCFRDTEITYDAFIRYISFVEGNDLGNFALTRASQSMKAYRHRFMHEKLLYHTDDEITALERAAYFGGRTECFSIGDQIGGPFLDLDINSLYPCVMKKEKMPLRVFDYYETTTMNDLTDIITRYGAIAEVEIETQRASFPFREKEKVLFPIGRFRTTLCTESLRDALEHGEIKSVGKCACYEMGYIFQEYVDFFYGLRLKSRETGNKIVDRMSKLFMNSLYGKFAQQREIIILKMAIENGEYSREEVYDALTRENQITTKLFNVMTVTRGREPIPGSIFSIPAHVTEYGRNLLWRIMEETGRDRVLYCDTDCIKIRKRDVEHVHYPIDEGKLGALKVESEYTSLSIHGPKDYETEHMRRIKGVPKNAVQLRDGSFEYKQFGRQLTHLRKGNVNDFIVKTTRKDLKREYTKGRVSRDGRVTPWVFPDDLKLVRSMQ
jgi:hypothetical protein